MIIYRIVFGFTDLIFFLFRSAQRRSIGHAYLTPVSLTLKFNMVTKVTNLYLLQISDLAAWFGCTIYLIYRNHRFQYGCASLLLYDVQRRLYSFALERKTPSIIMLRILFSRILEENRLSSKISHKKLR